MSPWLATVSRYSLASCPVPTVIPSCHADIAGAPFANHIGPGSIAQCCHDWQPALWSAPAQLAPCLRDTLRACDGEEHCQQTAVMAGNTETDQEMRLNVK